MGRISLLLGRGSLVAVLIAVVAGTGGAAIYAVLDPPAPNAPPGPQACPQPPCMDLDLPSGVELLTAVTGLGLAAALVLGGLAVAAMVLRRRPRDIRAAVLLVLGPLLVLLVMELVPHVVNPCLAINASGSASPVWCEGSDVEGRWHALHHAVVGAVPAALVYVRVIRRRRPELSPVRVPRRAAASSRPRDRASR